MIPLGVLGGSVVVATGSGAVTGTYLDTDAASNNASSYTFTGMDLGTASADRRIHVAVAVRKAAPSATVSSVTVAGISASQDVIDEDGGSTCAIWTAAVPTGTTGDVVVTLSTGVLRCHVHLYGTTGAASTPAGTAIGTRAQTTVFSLTSVADGFAIALAQHNNTAAVGTWTGATKNASNAVEISSEVASVATVGTPTAIECAWDISASFYVAAAVSYGPS